MAQHVNSATASKALFLSEKETNTSYSEPFNVCELQFAGETLQKFQIAPKIWNKPPFD